MNQIDFNSLPHLDAVEYIVQKLKNGLELSFAEQCVLLLIFLAQPKKVNTRENIQNLLGPNELWTKIQPILESLQFAFPSAQDISYASCFKTQIECEAIKENNKKAKQISTYIIRKQNTTEVKIGRSQRVLERINDLQNTSGVHMEVLAIIPEDIENKLHKKFSSIRTVGEWFNDSSGKIYKYSQELLKKYGN